MGARVRRSADEIRRWILDEVRRHQGCQDFQHPFEIVPARGQAAGDWEITGPQPNGPCADVFGRITHDAMTRFGLI